MPERPLRILHLATHTGIAGGGAVQMARMARGLRARGHQVACGFDRSSALGKAGEANFGGLEKQGITCVTFRMKALWSRVLAEHHRFRKFVKAQNFDIIHIHKPRALRFALESLSLETSTPVLVAQRGNSYALDDHAKKLFSDARVCAIVCVAEQVRDLVIAGGVAPEKVVTIYGGVDPTEFDFRIDGGAARKELGLPSEAPVVGIVANFDGKKGHDEFFQAAVLVSHKLPDARFLVVGRGAPPELSARLQEMGIKDRVLLAGFREDVPRMIAAMDVSVNCSNRGEGLTGALRESLCMKTPVVCTDVGGNRELVRDGETGRVVPPGDASTFAAAVVELLSDPARATLMGETGYRLVQKQFTEAVRIEKLERLYYDLVLSSRLHETPLEAV